MTVKRLVARFHTANPFTIAEQLNIEVRYVALPSSLKGQLMIALDNHPIILLNEQLIDSPERFVVMAHELKHAMEHADLLGYYALQYGSKGKLEREADEFASELMVYLYEEQYMELPETFEDLQHAYGVKEEMADYVCQLNISRE